ncbi:basic proline-rich protein-like [Dama dama]|uniref:basic proline-rich protein-like n=1 Tax=Dama dama TaxID=30532 RepID=UPI002A369B59|nr:basic proline-rich protein-like [Dama dama]
MWSGSCLHQGPDPVGREYRSKAGRPGLARSGPGAPSHSLLSGRRRARAPEAPPRPQLRQTRPDPLARGRAPTASLWVTLTQPGAGGLAAQVRLRRGGRRRCRPRPTPPRPPLPRAPPGRSPGRGPYLARCAGSRDKGSRSRPPPSGLAVRSVRQPLPTAARPPRGLIHAPAPAPPAAPAACLPGQHLGAGRPHPRRARIPPPPARRRRSRDPRPRPGAPGPPPSPPRRRGPGPRPGIPGDRWARTAGAPRPQAPPSVRRRLEGPKPDP